MSKLRIVMVVCAVISLISNVYTLSVKSLFSDDYNKALEFNKYCEVVNIEDTDSEECKIAEQLDDWYSQSSFMFYNVGSKIVDLQSIYVNAITNGEECTKEFKAVKEAIEEFRELHFSNLWLESNKSAIDSQLGTLINNLEEPEESDWSLIEGSLSVIRDRVVFMSNILIVKKWITDIASIIVLVYLGCFLFIQLKVQREQKLGK